MLYLLKRYAGFGLGVGITGMLLHTIVMSQMAHSLNDPKIFFAHLVAASAIYLAIADRV